MKSNNPNKVHISHNSTLTNEKMAAAMHENIRNSVADTVRHSMDAFKESVRMDMVKDNITQPDDAVLNAAIHARAFDEYVRTGHVQNALRETGGFSGGYLVPNSMERKIMEMLEEENVLRKICLVKPTREDTDIPIETETGSAVWVEEGGIIPDSDLQFGKVTLRAYKLATAENISNELLDDSAFDMENFIIGTLARRLSNAEETAFVDGDGNGKPLGLLRQAEVGVTTENVGSVNVDDLIDLIYSVPAQFRRSGILLMHPSTLTALYKFKTASGRNLWGCDLEGEFPLTCLGYPILLSDAMPLIASGNKALAFGDFKQFRIADRGGHRIRRLNEMLAQYDQTRFQITKRVDAVLLRGNAIRTLQVA